MTKPHKIVDGKKVDLTEVEIHEFESLAEVWKSRNKSHSEIKKLEILITPRRVREAILTNEGKMWLSEIEQQISDLRKKI